MRRAVRPVCRAGVLWCAAAVAAACVRAPRTGPLPIADSRACVARAHAAATPLDTVTIASLAGSMRSDQTLVDRQLAGDTSDTPEEPPATDCDAPAVSLAPAPDPGRGFDPAGADRHGRLLIGDDAEPVLRFVLLDAASDPRDALEGRGPGPRVDVVTTDDPAVAEYASRRPGLTVYSLPWHRTYVLVTPGQLASADQVPLATRTALARDAVRAPARAAEPPFWWIAGSPCPAAGSGISPSAEPVVGYDRNDRVARELATRITALLSDRERARSLGEAAIAAPAGAPWRVAGYDARALRDGSIGSAAAMLVVPYPRSRPQSCEDAAPRFSGAGEMALIDTRAYLIVREGVPPLRLDADGTFRVLPRSRP